MKPFEFLMKCHTLYTCLTLCFLFGKAQVQGQVSNVAAAFSAIETPLPLNILSSGVEYPSLTLFPAKIEGIPLGIGRLSLVAPDKKLSEWISQTSGAEQKSHWYFVAGAFDYTQHTWFKEVIRVGPGGIKLTNSAVAESPNALNWLMLSCLKDEEIKIITQKASITFSPDLANAFEHQDKLQKVEPQVLEMAKRMRGVRKLSFLTPIVCDSNSYNFAQQEIEWRNSPITFSQFGWVTAGSSKPAVLNKVSIPKEEARTLVDKNAFSFIAEVHTTVRGIALPGNEPKLWLDITGITLRHEQNPNWAMDLKPSDLGVDPAYDKQDGSPLPRLLEKATQ